MTKGMAYPGFFYLDASGVIREKYFKPKYTDRLTANNVIAKLFPELTEEVSQNVEAPHLRLTLAQSDRSVIPGSRVSLIAEIELPPDVHVYSPGVQGYKPIQLLQDSSGIELHLCLPKSKVLFLEAIQEHVPVFEGKFRITQDVTVTSLKTSMRPLVGVRGEDDLDQGELNIRPVIRRFATLQLCAVKWQLKVFPLDLKRSPEAIRHK